MWFRSTISYAHKWAPPPNPAMNELKRALNDGLSPLYINLRSDVAAGPWNTDKNFYGIICSPLFEGKSRAEMWQMVNKIVGDLGVNENCRFSLEPPSRWIRLYRKKRWRWGVD